jgi:hypothetical protein
VVENPEGQTVVSVVIDDREDAEGAIVDLVDGQVTAEVSQRLVEVGSRQRGLDFFPQPSRPSFGWWRRGRRRGGPARDANYLSAAQRRQLRKVTRGLPQLRALRAIVDEVYRLFDRRCRTATALKKLAKLRLRVRRFKKLGKSLNKLKSPNLEKALEFLDDKLLPSTSNAVERANRRFRKAQKSIYSVRTKPHLEQRLALDMQREQRAPQRQQTVKMLHVARSKPTKLH